MTVWCNGSLAMLTGNWILQTVYHELKSGLSKKSEKQTYTDHTFIFFFNKDPDGADDLLVAERKHLLKLKRILEAQLRSVQKQLQVLDGARKRLTASLQERSRVLDLICHAVCSVRGAGIKEGQAEKPLTPPVEPLGPYSPECARVISTAAEARQRSANLRKEVAEAIEQTVKLQKAAHQSVNDGLTQKVAETVTMKVCIYIKTHMHTFL